MRVLGLGVRVEGQVRDRARVLLGLVRAMRAGEGPRFGCAGLGSG